MEVPNVKRDEWPLLDISDDGFLSLMLADGSTKDDVKVPEGELGDKLKADFNDGKELLVTILTAMGEESCVSVKCVLCRVDSQQRMLTMILRFQGSPEGQLSAGSRLIAGLLPSINSLFHLWPIIVSRTLEKEAGEACAGTRCFVSSIPVIVDLRDEAIARFFACLSCCQCPFLRYEKVDERKAVSLVPAITFFLQFMPPPSASKNQSDSIPTKSSGRISKPPVSKQMPGKRTSRKAKVPEGESFEPTDTWYEDAASYCGL